MIRRARKIRWYQIIALIQRLPERDRSRLMQELEQKQWAADLEGVVAPIRSRLKGHRITDADIDRIVEEVRQRRYESRSGRL